MVIRAILLGALASVCVAIPRQLWAILPSDSTTNPWVYCFVGIFAAIIYRVSELKRTLREDLAKSSGRSLAGLITHVHYPRASFSPWGWLERGLVSLSLAVLGGRAGPEGSAIEISHGIAILSRPRSSNWLESQRRSDAAMVFSAGIAAAFGTPMAGVLLGIELGVGGSVLSSAIASLTATILVNWAGVLPSYNWPVLPLWSSWRDGVAVFAVTVAAAAVSALIVRFIGFAREAFTAAFLKHLWLKPLVGGIFLLFVGLAFKPANLSAPDLLQVLLTQPQSPLEAGLLALSQFLAISILVSAFGTSGIIWPLFSLGCLIGYAMEPVFPGYPRTSMVAGGAALMGAVLGAPLAGTVLAYELTNQWTVVVPTLIAALGANRLRAWLKTPTLPNDEMVSSGLDLKDGRSVSVLNSIPVRSAMVTDFEVVVENEMISEVRSALQKSPYPFVVVVNSRGGYVGILSEDQAAEANEAESAESKINYKPLGPIVKRFVEARDILYKAGKRAPMVRAEDPLSEVTALFQNTPVVAVQGEKGKVLGLLFVHEVRIAYERELARRHFLEQKSAQ